MRQEVQQVFDCCRYMISGSVDRVKWVNYLMYYGNYKFIDLYNRPMFWCNYLSVNNIPYASAVLAQVTPDYSELMELVDIPNQLITGVLSDCMVEMVQVYDSLGDNGLEAFITGIGVMYGRPSIDCWGILYYTSAAKCKKDRLVAREQMQQDYDNRHYSKVILDEDGKEQHIECTKYVLQ